MFIWFLNNWEWVLLGFFILEKIVKVTPIKFDDILIDAIGRGVWNGIKWCWKYIKKFTSFLYNFIKNKSERGN